MKRQSTAKLPKQSLAQVVVTTDDFFAEEFSVDDRHGDPVDVVKHSNALAEAIILQEIRFKMAEQDVVVDVGALVVVDTTEGLAFFQGNAFKIKPEQYSLDYNSENIVPSKAVLTRELSLSLGDTEVKIPAFTQILVDLENKIALLAGVHFDIADDEYSLLQ
jgi:hypothetical protein